MSKLSLELARQLFQARQLLERAWGDAYAAKIEPYKASVRQAIMQLDITALEVPLRLDFERAVEGRERLEGIELLAYVAASVEVSDDAQAARERFTTALIGSDAARVEVKP